MSKKQQLLRYIDSAIEHGEIEGITLTIENPDMNLPEEIYNPIENAKYKRDYIEKAYDDELCLKANPKIKITDCACRLYSETGTFGWALSMLKRGFKVARKGWNGKNQYIELATNISYVNSNKEIINVNHSSMGNKAIAFVGTSGVQLGWLASQSDMLSNDWKEVE
jgi:hypothetical protein